MAQGISWNNIELHEITWDLSKYHHYQTKTLCGYMFKFTKMPITKLILLVLVCIHVFYRECGQCAYFHSRHKAYDVTGSSQGPSVISSVYLAVASVLLVPYLYAPLQRSWKGVNWYHLVCLSVCPSVDRIVSALYLQEYSLYPFHICTSYQATSGGVSRVMPITKLINLKFWRIL